MRRLPLISTWLIVALSISACGTLPTSIPPTMLVAPTASATATGVPPAPTQVATLTLGPVEVVTVTAVPIGSPTVGASFITFNQFLQSVRAARFEDYAGGPGVAVRDRDAFEEMRQHILTMYNGAKQVSSFIVGQQYFDCITIDTQPSIRLLGIQNIERDGPKESVHDQSGEGTTPGESRALDSPLTLGQHDPFGNPISCPDGTIPMERITLDKLARYETLRDFFSKDSEGSGGETTGPAEDTPRPEDSSAVHHYAVGRQIITNFGGNSWLNLWNPAIAGGKMSLSQQWYAVGSGSSTQTVEGGWQVLPKKYSTDKAVLFIYWTADNYVKTGCYNLDCRGFVQTNNRWYLGGPWTNYSASGGTQWGFEMQWKLFRGNWWLLLKGSGSYEAVGYYPTSIYNGGGLARAASRATYGGETVGSSPWPQMGSGQLASKGWQNAAFQHTIFYIDRDENGGVGIWANLFEIETASSCYTVDSVPASSSGSWGAHLFFGGPGANSC